MKLKELTCYVSERSELEVFVHEILYENDEEVKATISLFNSNKGCVEFANTYTLKYDMIDHWEEVL